MNPDLRALRLAIARAMTDGPEAMASAAEVCRVCLDALPVDGGAFVAMSSDQDREVLSASDVVSAELEELQFGLGEGPCLQAFLTGRPVLIPDLSDLEPVRWPAFGPAIERLPIGGLFAFPIAVGAITIGVLDLYRTLPGPLSNTDLSMVLGVADLVAAALLVLRAGRPAVDADGAGLDGTTARWRQVHQATGMLIVQLGVPAEQAFARLRAYAFAHDQRIGEAANSVVARHLRMDLEPD